MEKLIGWNMVQEEAMGIFNPTSCALITKPETVSSEDFLFLLKTWSGNDNIKLTTANTIALNKKDAKDFKRWLGKGH